MDFRDWEKLEEDDKSVTLQHPKGHVMTIAVKALPKMQQEQIKRLKFAKGGDVLDSGEGGESEQGKTVRYANKTGSREEMGHAKEEAKGRAKMSRALPKPKLKGLAHGGPVRGVHRLSRKKGESEAGSDLRDMHGTREEQMQQDDDIKTAHHNVLNENRKINPKLQGLAKGGEVKYGNPELAKKGEESLRAKHAAQNTPEKKAKNDKFWGDADRELKQTNGPAMKKEYYDDGTPDGTVQGAPADDSSAPQTPAHTPITINVGTPPPAATTPQAPVPTQAPPKVEPVTTPPAVHNGLGQEARNTLSGVDQGMLGIQQQKAVDQAMSRAQVPAAEEALAKDRATAEQQQKAYQQIQQQTQSFNDWAFGGGDGQGNGIINPNRYVENMGTEQKTKNAIALAVGGFGTAFGGHNFAFDHLEKQIDRDVDAQKATFENRKNVYGAYQTLYGDSNITTALAKASTQDIYAKRIQLAGAQTGDPAAVARANAISSDLIQKSDSLRMNAAALAGKMGVTPGQKPGSMPAGGAQKPTGNNGGTANPGQAPSPQGTNGAPAPTLYSILKPGASDMVQSIAKNNPQFQARSGALHDQLEQAQRVEAVLNGPKGDGVGGIDDLFDQMYKAAGSGSKDWNASGNHVRRKLEDSVGDIPYVGSTVKGLMDVAPKDSDYQNYESAHGALTSDLGTALSKILPPSEMKHMVEPNMPQYRDTLADKARKKQFVVNTILKTAQFPDLDQARVTVGKKGK